jgi:hypothetical protein
MANTGKLKSAEVTYSYKDEHLSDCSDELPL